MAKYKVISNLDHDGKRYAPGSSVELDGETAPPLVDLGVIEAPKSDKPAEAGENGGKKGKG